MAAETAGRSSVGGAANEAGAEYRRGVAALFVAHGLNGSIPSELPKRMGNIRAVGLETDEPVDDLVVHLDRGRVLIQAKRKLTLGRAFNETAAQWLAALSEPGFDPDSDLLGVAAAAASNSIKTAFNTWQRRKKDPTASLTRTEQDNIRDVEAALRALGASGEDIAIIAKASVLLEYRAEGLADYDSQIGSLLLDGTVVIKGQGSQAWRILKSQAGHVARNRLTLKLEGWLQYLEDAEVNLVADERASWSSLQVLRQQALQGYLDRLIERGRSVSLSGIGIQLPPIPLDTIDLGLTVRDHKSDDDRSSGELLWALRRRGRAILTGLPGGGKSTAIHSTASQWASRPGWSTPVVVSLRKLADRERAREVSLQRAILSLAIENEPPSTRHLVSDQLEALMSDGDVVLFLDGLDEAADRSLDIASKILSLLVDTNQDNELLLATRDVAYADAQLLGLPAVRLNPPRDLDPVVRGLLSAFADHRQISLATPWVEQRFEWVTEVLKTDRQLRETPLVPVLLTALAADRDDGTLPTTRAVILKDAIEAVVRRRESPRDGTVELLPQSLKADVIIETFGVVAAALGARGGSAQRDDIVSDLVAYLQSEVGQHPAVARSTARDVARFWDEAGVFVAEGADKLTSPRVQLFMEIGDAINATRTASDPGAELTRWLGEPHRRETLILTAGMSRQWAEALLVHATASGDDLSVRIAAEAIDQGAEVSEDHLRRFAQALIDRTKSGDEFSWRCFQQLVRMDVPNALRQPTLDALAGFGPDHRRIGTALAVIEWDLDLPDRATLLEEAIHITSLPKLKADPIDQRGSRADRGLALVLGGMSQALMRCKVAAARELLPSRPDLAEEIASSLGQVSMWASKELATILDENGYQQLTKDSLADSPRGWERWARLADGHQSEVHSLLNEIQQWNSAANLTKREARRLDELADFVETLNLNDISAWPSASHFDVIESGWLNAVAELGGFNKGVLAAQASIVMKEMEHDVRSSDRQHEHAAFYALFDSAELRKLDNWSRVDSPDEARQLALSMLPASYGCAVVGARALSAHPSQDETSALIAEVFPNLSHRVARFAVLAFVILRKEADEAFAAIADHENPAVRAAAASFVDVISEDGNLTEVATMLALDTDRSVQIAALDRIADQTDSLVPGLENLLRRIRRAGSKPFRCTSCGALNDANRRSCQDCNVVNERPDRRAIEILESLG